MKANLLNVQSLLWLALVLALAGSLRHLAEMFASIDGNLLYGYLSAIAVDAGLFSLSYSLKLRKGEQRGTAILWLGIILFTAISVYGNFSYGLTAIGQPLPGWMVASKPIVLAASLPILVLYLAELVSDNRQHAARQAQQSADGNPLTSGNPAGTNSLAEINAGKIATKAERKRQLLALHQQDPQRTISEFAKQLGVSRGTVRNYASELGLDFATGGSRQVSQ